jgi:hypothetical protein
MRRLNKENDDGASLVFVLLLVPLVMLALLPIATYAVTGIRNQKFTALHVGQHSSGASASATSVYNADAAMKIATNDVRSATAAAPCAGYNKTILGLTVKCASVDSSIAPSCIAPCTNNPGVSPSNLSMYLYPGQTTARITKTVVADGHVLSAMSGKNGCNFSARKNTAAGTAINFPPPATPGVPNNAYFQAGRDEGLRINVWENGSCVNDVGNGNGGVTTYYIDTVVSPTSITLTTRFGGNGTPGQLKNYQWEIPVPAPVTVAAVTNIGSASCPDSLLAVTLDPPTGTGVQGQTFTFIETITVNPGVASTASDDKYICTVKFTQNGATATSSFTETNTITVLKYSDVYLTALDGSRVLGQTKVQYDNTSITRPPTVKMWTLDNRG